MTEKNKKSTAQKEGGESKKSTTVVLKADLHCEGCASKLLKSIRSFHGVDSARIESGHKMTVVGRVDAVELREHVEKKTHNKVELISPQPTGKNGSNKEKENMCSNKSSGKVDRQQSKIVEKKPIEKEVPVTTAVLKMNLHCQGCMQKIRKRVTKTKGYREMKIDRQKELVTVIGAMDMKALAEGLKKHLKRNVEILLPPKTASEKKENGVEEKEKKSGGGGEKEKKSGGGQKGKSGGGGEGGEPTGGNVEGKRVQTGANPNSILNGPGLTVDQFYYYYPDSVHAPQLFSDENPNACTVM